MKREIIKKVSNGEKNKVWVKPLALASYADGSPGTFIIFKIKDYDGKDRVIIMNRNYLGNIKDIKRFLIDHGYPSQSNPKHWHDVFILLFQDIKGRAMILKKPGFYEMGYLLANNKRIGFKDAIKPHLDPACKFDTPIVDVLGELDDWKNHVAVLALSSSRLMLSLTTSFSAYLTRWVGIESGGFHIFGVSSMGKSTSLYLAESVRGPRQGLGSWDFSESGITDYMAGHNDSLITLDELKHLDENQVKAHQKASKITYKITSGQAKKLSSGYQDGSQQKAISWRVVVISTGELSLTAHACEANANRLAGEEVRLVDVPADAGKNLGIFESLPPDLKTPHELARLIDDCTKLYYGTASIQFLKKQIKYLNEDKTKFISEVRSKMDLFLEKHDVDLCNGFEVRFAERFALSYAAGCLAVKYNILPFKKNNVMQGISKCYRDAIKEIPMSFSIQVKKSRDVLDDVLKNCEFLDISKNNHGFSEEELKCDNYYLTSIKDNIYKAIPSKLLKKIVSDENVRTHLLDALVKEGILLCNNGKRTRSPAIRIKKSILKLPRCYCFIQ